MRRKLMMTFGGVALFIGATVGFAGVASAATGATSGPYPVIGGADGHSDGTVLITNHPSTHSITITFTPKAGLSITGGFVCIGENSSSNTGESYFKPGKTWALGSSSSDGFTARVNPGSDAKGCSTGTYFVLQQFTGGGPWTVTGVPSSFFTNGMYLQIHASVSNGDTGMGCGVVSVHPFYGNCPDYIPSHPVPVGTIGGLGLAVVVGGAFVFVQRRRGGRKVNLQEGAAV